MATRKVTGKRVKAPTKAKIAAKARAVSKGAAPKSLGSRTASVGTTKAIGRNFPSGAAPASRSVSAGREKVRGRVPAAEQKKTVARSKRKMRAATKAAKPSGVTKASLAKAGARALGKAAGMGALAVSVANRTAADMKKANDRARRKQAGIEDA